MNHFVQLDSITCIPFSQLGKGFEMIKKTKKPYIRDVYLAYLIDGANRTEPEGFPIIEEDMVTQKPPSDVIQWDRRKYDVVDASRTTICFYCNDVGFVPVLNNPEKYVKELKKYESVIGPDASPYDNMPLVVQNSQIYVNLAITYYLAKNGVKIIPNIRLGNGHTIASLKAYPTGTLIAIGTHGFTRNPANRHIFREQIEIIVKTLKPLGIVVYGPVNEYLFPKELIQNTPIYQFDSYTMKQNRIDRERRTNEGQ